MYENKKNSHESRDHKHAPLEAICHVQASTRHSLRSIHTPSFKCL